MWYVAYIIINVNHTGICVYTKSKET